MKFFFFFFEFFDRIGFFLFFFLFYNLQKLQKKKFSFGFSSWFWFLSVLGFWDLHENVWFLNFSIFFSYFGLQKSLSLSMFSNICIHSFFFSFFFFPFWGLLFCELKLLSNYEVLHLKVFDDCTKVLLSLSVCVCVCVCLSSVWVLRKCVKIKSFKFIDMVFDWLWWGFCLLGNKYGPVMGF